MKYKTVHVLLFSTLIPTLSLATTTVDTSDIQRLEIALERSDEGNINPRLYLPLYWNDHLSSAVGFTSGRETVFSELSAEVAPSNSVLSYTYQSLKLDLLNYTDTLGEGSYTLGLSVNLRYIDITQFSYYNYKLEGETNKRTGVLDVPAYHKVYDLGLYADYTITEIWDVLSIRVGSYLYPLSYLHYEETMNAYPESIITNHIEGSTLQEIQYNIFTDLLIQTYWWTDISMHFQYGYTSVTSKTLQYEDTVHDFVATDTYLGGAEIQGDLKLLINHYGAGGIKPMIGVSYIKRENNTLDEEKSSEGVYFLLGMEKKF